MISGYIWESGTEKPREATPDCDWRALAEKACVCWLDFADPTPDEYRLLSTVFAFHPLAIEDCMHYSQRPKLEQYGNHLFLVTHVVRHIDDDDIDMPEVDLFVQENIVVTVHKDPAILADVRRRCRDLRACGAGMVGFLVHAILDTVIDSYFPALDACGNAIDGMEEAVMAGEDGACERIAAVRRILLTMQHRVNPQADILARLTQRNYAFINDETAPYFQDVYDHAARIAQNLSHYRDLLGHVFEMSLAGAAHKTNEIMRRLTVVSTVFLPLTFIVGVYGMNFRYMPELAWRPGYFAIWGVMLLVAAGMMASFRRQKWL